MDKKPVKKLVYEKPRLSMFSHTHNFCNDGSSAKRDVNDCVAGESFRSGPGQGNVYDHQACTDGGFAIGYTDVCHSGVGADGLDVGACNQGDGVSTGDFTCCDGNSPGTNFFLF